MIYRIRHTTEYHYPVLVRNSHNELRLQPLSDVWQTCREFRLTIGPLARVFGYDLPNGAVHHFSHRQPYQILSIHADSLVECCLTNPFTLLDLIGDDRHYYTDPRVLNDWCEYLAPSERVPTNRYVLRECEQIAASAQLEALGPSTASFLLALNTLLHREFRYEPGFTDVQTRIDEVFIYRKGVCQDFAQVMIAVCRTLNIPARYVSGYLYTGHNGLISNDATHAWVECLLPDGAWHGFDPTNNMLVNDAYIRVHTGRDYSDVPPVRGVYSGPPADQLNVKVTVEKIVEP